MSGMSRKTTSYPAYKNGELLYARWSEDGLWYKAKVTDLLPETQSYLVVFVEYGNSQACTLADLAPLDMPVTKAAPPPLAEVVDPVTVEMQRQARIEERRLQLKAEEEARKAVLEEKRRLVAERKAKMEALERAEQMAKIEEQREKLEAKQPAAVAQLRSTPGPGPRPADAPIVTATAAFTATTPMKQQALSAPAAATTSTPVAAKQQQQVPIAMTPAPPSSVDQKAMQKRMTLSAAGGSGAKLGAMKGVTLKELKEVAAKTPIAALESTPKKNVLDMTVSEARAARALDFGSGDTPQKKQAVEEVRTPAPPTAEEKKSKPVVPPVALTSGAKMVAAESDEEDDEEEEDSDPMSPRPKVTAPASKPTPAPALPAPEISPVSAQPLKQQRRSVLLPLPPVIESDDANDSLGARQALHEFSVAAKNAESPPSQRYTTTTQILADLEDSLDSDLAELEELRREANEVDATINLFQQLKEETNRLERTASSFAADLGDLEEEARLLLGE